MLKRFKLFWLELSLTSLNLSDVSGSQLLDTPRLGEALLVAKTIFKVSSQTKVTNEVSAEVVTVLCKATLPFFKNIHTLILCKFVFIKGHKLSLHNMNPYYKSIESVIQK